MLVNELMTKVIANVPPHEKLSSAVALMRKNSLSCVIVSEKEKPKGIITERDIVRLYSEMMTTFEEPDTKALDPPVNDVMTMQPVCIQESTSLHDALMLAESRKVRHFLVIDNKEKLVGVITQTDMVNAYSALMAKQEELETENKMLQLLSYEDSLMQIGNRRAMKVELSFCEDLKKRYKKTYAVALIDVDFFKKYNDHYGHHAGDEVLSKIASTVKNSMRETDRLFRYGGEEILMLLPEARNQYAFIAAERARKAVDDLKIPHAACPIGHITISAGVASENGKNWQELVDRADKALYRAKNLGRNNVSE